MIATSASTLTNSGLPINWVDGAILILLGFGIFRGRKNGMTREIAPTAQWLAVIFVAGLGYPILAQVYATHCQLDKLWSALAAYLSIAIVLFLAFTPIKNTFTKRAEKGGLFGGSEYYLGMCTGMVRYTCIIVFALALLNARSYTAAEIAAKKAYNERWYGGGIYSGDYMPDLHTAQDAVFKESLTGPYIQTFLADLLIQTGPGSGGGPVNAPHPQAVIHIGS